MFRSKLAATIAAAALPAAAQISYGGYTFHDDAFADRAEAIARKYACK